MASMKIISVRERWKMKKFDKSFFVGAATAAHQVEGNNMNSDYWVMEQLEHSNFAEPSLDAVDHYNRYEEDIRLMAEAGLNAYRFSVEWARIEPEKGRYDEEEIEHYRKVLQCCHHNGLAPVVTMHHFSSPKWLIAEGGWENEAVVGYFKDYCAYVASKLGDLMGYVCTINEANMGLQVASVAKDIMRRMGITPQIGMNFEELMACALPADRLQQKKEIAEAFGLDDPNGVHDFLSMRTDAGDLLIMQAHAAAREAMKTVCPHLQVGLTLSLYDIQPQPGGERIAEQEWADDFGHYLPYIQEDDFIGVQNYSRKLVDCNGGTNAPEGAELTQMGYEFYPQGIGHVVRRVAEELPGKPILVTENGVATADDERRKVYIREATDCIMACVEDGIPVKGYFYWSLLDNFEWQKGYSMTFGLIAVDRKTQKRMPKDSLRFLGEIANSADGR